ncbi:precorrin-6A/cobalt-precorrin-6A reductase [Sulfitobacter sp. S190]|uniref:precorrin-6A/cobalt-precorrin-6A reductase n=1 Tax=Sulfitobacter sp. S190 TaxID=2867022 RepID=UPI0021A8E3A8|nr:precorrin-6A/cobalt-precorrin-6A reductase [Sulfitobacter sp. S190]UWR23789.1 precorrin-6A/cobalt-precorrin-6A reductase [Sulfitobacter sp. S190]
MTTLPHILLLAGSFEARQVAEALCAAGIAYTPVVSELPRGGQPLPKPPQLRAFDGAQGLGAFVQETGLTAILDASHVFDRTLTQQAFGAARRLNMPYLRLERPAWDDAQCTFVPDVRTACAAMTAGARAFCATGWESLPDMARFTGDRIFLRQTRRHDRAAPYPFVSLSFGDPPFDVAHERALFARLRITHLVCRNLGGRASRPKLDAALAMGLAPILIDRPSPPAGLPTVSQVAQAAAWAAAL